MLSFPVILAWFAFLFAILWGLQRLTRWATRLNIFTLFVGFMVLRHGITVPFDHTVNQWYAGIDISPAAYRRYYLSLVLMWVFIFAGVCFARATLGSVTVDPTAFRRAISQQILPEGCNGFFPLLLGISLALVMWFNLRPSAELGKILTGSLTGAEYRAMRDDYGVATHYSAGLGNRLASIVRFGLFPTLVCTLYFLKSRGGIWRIAFFLTLGLGLLVALISGQKGAIVFLLLGLAIAAYYRSGRIRLQLMNWRIWVSAAGGILGITFLYLRQYPGQSFGWALQATTYRLTSEADRSLQLYFQIYPDVRPFLCGHSSSLINALLGSNISVDQLPERFIPTYYLGPKYLNTWNGAFIGVAWTDFGYVGVIVESFFVGWLLFAYARWFRQARITATVMGTQVGLMMSVTRLSEVSLTANLLSFGLLSSFILYLIIRKKTPIARHPENILSPALPDAGATKAISGVNEKAISVS